MRPWLTKSGVALPLITLAIILSSPICAQKRSNVRLDTDELRAARSSFQRIAADGDKVYVVWQDGRNGGNSKADIYFNRSLDGGASWLLSDVRLDSTTPGTSQSRAPEIAVSGESVYVTWGDKRTGNWNIYFSRSLDAGNTWLSSNVRLNLGQRASQSFKPPQIAAAGDRVYVVWEDQRNGRGDIYIDYSFDRGTTWLDADIRLDTNFPGATASTSPKIAVEGNLVCVAWSEGRISSSAIYVNRSIDGGITWLSEDIPLEQETPAYGGSWDPEIAISGDSVYVVWRDNAYLSHDIYINYSHDRGRTWRFGGRRLNTDAPDASKSELPKISATGDKVTVIWREFEGNPHIYLNQSLDRGITWLDEVVQVDADLPVRSLPDHPQLAASGDSLYVTWDDLRHRAGHRQTTDIYFNRSLDGGSSWLGADVRLSSPTPGTAFLSTPQIAASGESVYVVWNDNGDSGGAPADIYFNIPFGAQPFGEGTPGSNDITPKLEGTDSLNLGSSFTLSISNGLGGAFGLLALGGPGSKTSIPMLGGNLLIDPIDRIIPIKLEGSLNTPGAGSLSIDCPIPDDPAFLGFNVNLQALIIDPGSATGVAWTNAVEAWIL